MNLRNELEIELDGSYFGARMCAGRERGAEHRAKSLFSECLNENKVYAQIVKNCSKSELVPIIQGKADSGVIICSDGLVNYGYKKCHSVKYGENESTDG